MAERVKFNLTARYAEIKKEPFEFVWPGGDGKDRDWTLPYIQDIDLRVLEACEAEDVTALRQAFEIAFELAGQDEAWAEAPKPTSAIKELFHAWQEWDGVQPGESEASSDSSTSTGRPSKQTSRGSTKSGSRQRSSARAGTAAAPGS
ncbi:hypothetical protein [Catenuloplanes japonicus]|uniref:hypothetical protein n=1 Tax=Catenuloplanes japonicus TaxID=33876 RepID=UPI0006922FC7|nr:hypothetical protein [Catenuloplanes japonicus]